MLLHIYITKLAILRDKKDILEFTSKEKRSTNHVQKIFITCTH